MLATLPNSQHHLPMNQHNHAESRNVKTQPMSVPEYEGERPCGGCNRSVNSERGVVVAFGSSLWHVECFKCAKCGNQVNPDTNLLLLSDGSPVCANCYNCKVCNKPILDEAVMTGDDSYHAACFTCRTCHKRIDELVFAKTSQGFYCMKCHNERVARSRRHLAKKQHTKERERERQATSNGSGAKDSNRSSNGLSKSPTDPVSANSSSQGTDFTHSPIASQLEHTPSDGHVNNRTPLHSPLASSHPSASTSSSSAAVPENVATQTYTNGATDNIPTFTLDSLTMSPEMGPTSPPLNGRVVSDFANEQNLPPAHYGAMSGNGYTSPRSSGRTHNITELSAPTSPTANLTVRSSDSNGNSKISVSHSASHSDPTLLSSSTLAFLSPNSAEMFKQPDISSANYPSSTSAWPSDMEQHKRRKSFDDGVRPSLSTQSGNDGESGVSGTAPLNVAKSKREKRGSIDPRMHLEVSKWQQNSASPSSGTSIAQSPTASGTAAGTSSSLTPVASQGASRSPTSPTKLSGQESPKVTSPLRDYFNGTDNDEDMTSAERKSNSSGASNTTAFYSPAASPQSSINRNDSPTSTSRSMTAPVPASQTKGATTTEVLAKPPSRSDSLRLPNGAGQRQNGRLLPVQQTLRPKRSFDDRSDRLSPRMRTEFGATDMGKRSRSVSPKPPDVPHGIESGTDTDADGDNEMDTTQTLITHRREPSSPRTAVPPALPPKDMQMKPVGANAGLKIEALPTSNGTRSPAHSRDASRDSDLQDEVPSPVQAQERQSAFFVAPALPPMRFSMNGTDFKDILNSLGGVGGPGKRPGLQRADAFVTETGVPDTILEDVAVDDAKKPLSPTTETAQQAEGSQKSKENSAEQHGSKGSSKTATNDSPRLSNDGNRPLSPSSPRLSIRSAHRLSRSEAAIATGSIPTSPRTSYESRTPGSPRSSENGHTHRNGSDVEIQRPPITISTSPDTPTIKLSGRKLSLTKNDATELVLKRLKQALAHAADRGVDHVKLDRAFVEAIVSGFERKRDEVQEMSSKLDRMKRASQMMIDGLSVAQDEYDQELAARRHAEAEVSRLKIELSGQAARLTALSEQEKKSELHQKLTKELSENLTGLEHDLSKLKVERDMALAEVEELSASKSSLSTSAEAPAATATVSRSLTMRLDNIKKQYQHELVPLTQQREALAREIQELKQAREVFLEETAVLNARNEELAQLNSQYERRLESAAVTAAPTKQQVSATTSTQQLKADTWKSSRNAPGITNALSSSTASSVTLGDDPTERAAISKPIQAIHRVDIAEVPVAQTRQAGIGLRWPGKRANKDAAANLASSSDNSKGKKRMDHSFQQLSILRIARCDHCGEKMWGSQVRCTACNLAVHVRCVHSVSMACMQDASAEMNEDNAVLVSPPPISMFGRDLIEQVKADSRGGTDRLVPILVEKCIDAVDALALDYEGIYRKTGGSAQSKAITSLFERGDYDAFDLKDSDSFNDISSVTSVLKSYFRSLPDPLLTYNLHESFVAAATIRDPSNKAAALSGLVAELPLEHFHTLGYLMMHLHKIQQISDKNLMSARNLGLIFGPTLMRSSEPGREFADMAGKSLVIEWLIENAPSIFNTAVVSR